MNRVPEVSIVTPAYNAARFIGEAITSVRVQTFPDWEMLVADDGSRDDTRAIVERLAAQDACIILIPLEGGCGASAARNAALARARGRYICFLDADDLWLPQKLERQLAFMRKTGCALSYTGYQRMTQDGRVLGRPIQVPERMTYRELLRNTAVATSTSMVDRAQTGPIRFTGMGHEDYALWLSLLRRGLEARGLNEDLARYRVVEGSLSSRPLRSAGWVWRIYREREHLNPVYALWCLSHYGLRAVGKRLRFWPAG